jgi:RNA-directed DNA polymerase
VIGVAVNATKSPGIHLLVPEGASAEIECTSSVDYLGYRIRTDGVHLKPQAEQRIKARIDQLIYNTLLREPMNGTQAPQRVAVNVDRDYVTLMSRIRRYLYGDLSERELRRYQRQGAPLRRFKGVMAAYPLLDDAESLAGLDRWILDRLWLAVRRRGLILDQAGFDELPPPHGCSREELRTLAVTSRKTKTKIDLSAPSVRRIASVVMEAAGRHGATAVGTSSPYED